MNPLLIRKRPGNISRFELDSELVEFLDQIDSYYSIKQLHILVLNRFGKERTPSKSSLHRYLQKITSQNNRGNQ